MLLFDEKKCVSICVKNTNSYVRLAVEDLRRDFIRVSKSRLKPEITEKESECCIVIEQNFVGENEALADESFSIKSEGGKIIISAAGYLGSMWGIYTFSEKYLGVNPCYLFDDLETEKHERIELAEINELYKPEGFAFRGIFINDEDLLTGWKDDVGLRYLGNFPWYRATVGKSVMNMVVETALRLKVNLVIPASFLDIDNPSEKLLVDCVARRGIFVSQHHLEPIGLSSYTFKNYCAKFGLSGEFSYIKNPEIMERAWEYYAAKWAKYDNVVWQIGLRGEGDRPVWQEAVPTDSELKSYGEFISKAYTKEKEIIVKATSGKAKYFTSTLWMEGSALAEKGYLKFPLGTIVVFADSGINQMYGNEFYSLKRGENKSGIYYHLQYYGAGPHLVPQTGLNKLYHNTALAYRKGDNSYYILNVSNVREFVFEIKAFSEMTWNIEKFSKEEYLDCYCKVFGEFGGEIKRLINRYYESLPTMSSDYLSEHYPYNKFFNLYLKDDFEGFSNYILKEGDIINFGGMIMEDFKAYPPLKKWSKVYYERIKKAIPEFERIYDGLSDIADKLPERLSRHIRVKWLLFSKTLLCVYKWYISVYDMKSSYDLCETEKTLGFYKAACESLEEYLKYRKCAEYGEFENWYRGDTKMNIKQQLYNTKRFLGQTPDFC